MLHLHLGWLYCEFCFRIALSSDSVVRRPSSQLWHPSFSPLYDVLNLTTHIFSESLWHVLFTDAPVMTMKKTHANTKTKTKTMTKTKWLKDPTCAISLKMIWLKDIKYNDEGDAPQVVMHHRWWCTTGGDAPFFAVSRCFSTFLGSLLEYTLGTPPPPPPQKNLTKLLRARKGPQTWN